MVQVRKVVDITDVPPDVYQEVWDDFSDNIHGNDSFITFSMLDDMKEDEIKYDSEGNEIPESVIPRHPKFHAYLKSFGVEESEDLIVLIWW